MIGTVGATAVVAFPWEAAAEFEQDESCKRFAQSWIAAVHKSPVLCTTSAWPAGLAPCSGSERKLSSAFVD